MLRGIAGSLNWSDSFDSLSKKFFGFLFSVNNIVNSKDFDRRSVFDGEFNLYC